MSKTPFYRDDALKLSCDLQNRKKKNEKNSTEVIEPKRTSYFYLIRSSFITKVRETKDSILILFLKNWRVIKLSAGS